MAASNAHKTSGQNFWLGDRGPFQPPGRPMAARSPSFRGIWPSLQKLETLLFRHLHIIYLGLSSVLTLSHKHTLYLTLAHVHARTHTHVHVCTHTHPCARMHAHTHTRTRGSDRWQPRSHQSKWKECLQIIFFRTTWLKKFSFFTLSYHGCHYFEITLDL